jgi:hypothetical protein
MTHLRSVLVIVLAVGLDACTQKRDTATDEADVKAAIESFYAAMKKGDPKTAKAMLAPDAEFVETGRRETRQQKQESHLPADIEFEKDNTGTRGPWTIKVNGDTAWGIASTTYDAATPPFVSTQLAVVTRGEDGKWLIRSIHWSSMRL